MRPSNPISEIPVDLTPTGGTTGLITGGFTTGVAQELTVLPIQLAGFIPLTDCSAEECRTYNGQCYKNKVLGSYNINSSTYENDLSTFFLYDAMRRIANFTLQKLDERLQVWNDQALIGSTYPLLYPFSPSYGTFYGYGYFTTHPNYMGVQINWGNVLTVSGPGVYRLKVVAPSNIAGFPAAFPYCMTSEAFTLLLFDCEVADRTAKFEANNSGKLGSHLSNGTTYDLCNATFYDSIRLPGFFGHKKGGYDRVQLEYQNGLIDPVRDENILKYQWLSRFLPQYIHDRFMAYGMMADSIFVSDYNYNNSDYNIRKKRIVADGGYEPVYNAMNRLSDVKVDFKEGIQSIIKSTSCDKAR